MPCPALPAAAADDPLRCASAEGKQQEKQERELYGRFFYRFPNGESGADVYDRMTMFGDHLVRDIDGGRFPEGCNIVIVTHGLTLRIFLARWLHWTVSEYEEARFFAACELIARAACRRGWAPPLQVWNPPNSVPLVLQRRAVDDEFEEACNLDGTACDLTGELHTKDLYRLTPDSMAHLRCGSDAMAEMLLPEKAWSRTLSSDEIAGGCALINPNDKW